MKTGKATVAALAVAGVISALSISPVAGAATSGYPDKPVTIVFPNKAGSGYYNVIQAVLHQMRSSLPVQARLVPMPGAGGAAGTRYVANEPADGYTLLFMHTGIFIASAMHRLGFDFLDKFKPVARVNQTCFGLWARKDAPYNNLKQLARYSKTHGPLKAGVQIGLTSQFQIAKAGQLTGARMTPVQVSGGSAGFAQALMSKDVDVFPSGPVGVAGLLKAGKIKSLAYFGSKRSSVIPGTPTAMEQGYGKKPFCISGYLWARKSVPNKVVAFWNHKLKVDLTDPRKKSTLQNKLGADIDYRSGPALAAPLQHEYSEWTRLIQSTGTSPN